MSRQPDRVRASGSEPVGGDHREPARRRWSRRLLAGLLTTTGVAHLVVPDGFEQIVPRWLPGEAGLWNGLSAAAELGSAALLANRRTARLGGAVALATLLGVWPANVQAALDGGYRAFAGWLASPAAAWIRVPLQVPLLWWAWTHARRPHGPDAIGSIGRRPGTVPPET